MKKAVCDMTSHELRVLVLKIIHENPGILRVDLIKKLNVVTIRDYSRFDNVIRLYGLVVSIRVGRTASLDLTEKGAKFLREGEEIKIGYGRVLDIRERKGSLHILKVLKGGKKLTLRFISEQTNSVSELSIRLDLALLLKEGIVSRTNERPYRYYIP